MVLETVLKEDYPLLEKISTDPEMMAYLGGPLTPNQVRADHDHALAKAVQGDWCFKISPNAGTIGIWRSNYKGESIYEIGWMVRPEFQGKGLASKALDFILEKARRERYCQAVWAFPAIANIASNRLCEKNGFSKIRESVFHYRGRALQCAHWLLEF